MLQDAIYDTFMERFLKKVDSITNKIGNRKRFKARDMTAMPELIYVLLSSEPKVIHGHSDIR